MKISELLKKKKTLSFEVFPPKMDKPMEPLLNTLDNLYKLKPDFISCTYGAGGTNRGRNTEICREILKSGHDAVAHFTCIGNTKDDVESFINEYAALGIENVLAIRGDLPEGWEGTRGDFQYADDLLEFLREKFPAFCIACAGYPEKHIDALSMEDDIKHLKEKQDKGADLIMTQLCHDVSAYSAYREMIADAGVNIPVVVGIMPILGREGTIRMALSNGCAIPAELSAIIGKYDGKPEDFKKAGKEYTAKQIERYVSAGVDGIHIYSMNKHEDVTDVLKMSGIMNKLEA